MELLTTLAVVAGLFGASHSAGNIESSRPIQPPALFPFTTRSNEAASPHIVGGKEAIPRSHPHQVFLSIRNQGDVGNGWFCGGSLISDSWVVTAAHCLEKSSNGNKLMVMVAIGAHRRPNLESQTTAQVVEASKIILHPEYDSFTIANDIGLLKLDERVCLDGKVAKSIRLPKLTQKSESFKGSTVTVTGWGETDPATNKMPDALHTADTEVIGNFHCKFRYLFLMVKDTNICTSTRTGTDACYGDSGGPMIVKEADGEPTLIGITSFGIGCAWLFPGVFTRVTSYLDWIHNITDIAPRY